MKILMLIILLSFLTLNLNGNAESSIDEKDLYDSYLTLLNPYASKVIVEELGKNVQWGLTDAKIIELERVNKGKGKKGKVFNEGSFDFIVTVQYKTFFDAHNPPYGLETLTFRIKPGDVKLINFEHKDT